MATTFIVEDGSGVDNANAYLEVTEADQIIENYGNPSDWSSASTAEKQNAIREATRYLDLNYTWDGYKVYEDQVLQWPRYEMYDEDDNYMAEDEVPLRVRQACAYLASKVVAGDTLIKDQQDEGAVKRTKDVIGPLTKEREYVVGENPEKSYKIPDKLVDPFVLDGNSWTETELERG